MTNKKIALIMVSLLVAFFVVLILTSGQSNVKPPLMALAQPAPSAPVDDLAVVRHYCGEPQTLMPEDAPGAVDLRGVRSVRATYTEHAAHNSAVHVIFNRDASGDPWRMTFAYWTDYKHASKVMPLTPDALAGEISCDAGVVSQLSQRP